MTKLGLALTIFAVALLVVLLTTTILHLKNQDRLHRGFLFRFIDPILIALSLAGITATMLWDFNFLDYAPPVEHKDWKSITLASFRGRSLPSMRLDGMKDFAFICTSIDMAESGNEVEIKTLFHPCRSYVFDKDLYSPGLLEHELYHFHLTEYCARLMRKEITNYRIKNPARDLSIVRTKYLDLEGRLQSQYDDETYHSYVRQKQSEWQFKVDKWLDSLTQYSNTTITYPNLN
jgi:hypothetical protein